MTITEKLLKSWTQIKIFKNKNPILLIISGSPSLTLSKICKGLLLHSPNLYLSLIQAQPFKISHSHYSHSSLRHLVINLVKFQICSTRIVSNIKSTTNFTSRSRNNRLSWWKRLKSTKKAFCNLKNNSTKQLLKSRSTNFC